MSPRKPKSQEPGGATPLPTDAELAILQLLWAEGPQTVREVFDALEQRQIRYTTILKQMQMMTEKGLVKRNERYRSHVYEAVPTRESVQSRLVGNFLDRAFSGSAKGLVMGALSAKPVSKSELSEIRRMIEEFEGGR